MATSFDTIEDLALVSINDYRLAKLYNQSEDDFRTYLDGFLLRGVPYFTQCRQTLEYDAINRQFTADLTLLEQSILADLLSIEHYRRDNDTAALYRQHLQNSGSFKNHSEAAALKEHSAVYDKLYEQLSRDIMAYEMADLSSYF